MARGNKFRKKGGNGAKYFSNRKISFLLLLLPPPSNGNESTRVRGRGGGEGGEEEEGMATVGKWPCHTRELLWYEVMRTAKHARRYYVMFQEVCWWPGIGGIIFINERSWLTVSSLGGEREREREREKMKLSIVPFYLDLFICQVLFSFCRTIVRIN